VTQTFTPVVPDVPYWLSDRLWSELTPLTWAGVLAAYPTWNDVLNKHNSPFAGVAPDNITLVAA